MDQRNFWKWENKKRKTVYHHFLLCLHCYMKGSLFKVVKRVKRFAISHAFWYFRSRSRTDRGTCPSLTELGCNFVKGHHIPSVGL